MILHGLKSSMQSSICIRRVAVVAGAGHAAAKRERAAEEAADFRLFADESCSLYDLCPLSCTHQLCSLSESNLSTSLSVLYVLLLPVMDTCLLSGYESVTGCHSFRSVLPAIALAMFEMCFLCQLQRRLPLYITLNHLHGPVAVSQHQ